MPNAEREIWGDGEGVYVIAEAGVNHNGELATARELVTAAKRAGADAVKFQAFTAEELVVKGAAKAAYQQTDGPAGESQFEMLKRLELGETAFEELRRFCKEMEIDFVVTPFSRRWTEVLREIGVKAFKVGSGNVSARPLLKAIGQTGLPAILSTGMAGPAETDAAIALLRKHGNVSLAVLHCVSLYPTPLERTNLRMIGELAERTGLPTGFSDHTRETATGALAVAAGAQILEKHLTLDRRLAGPDHAMSLGPVEMRDYIYRVRQAARIRGSGAKTVSVEEAEVKTAATMSVVVGCDKIKAGTVITQAMIENDNLTVKRPGGGIGGERIYDLIGKTIGRDVYYDHILDEDDLVKVDG